MSKNLDENEGDSLRQKKLRYEVEALRRSLAPWYRRPASLVGTIGAVFVFLTVAVGFLSKAAEVGKTREELSEAKQSLIATLTEKDILQARLDATQAQLKQANTQQEEKQKEVRDLESKIRTLETELKDQTLQGDSAKAAIVQQRGELDELQRLTASLADDAISESPNHSGLESSARAALRKVYHYRSARLQRMVNEIPAFGLLADIWLDGHEDDYREEIIRLQKQIDEMEASYPWIKQ